MKKRESDPFLTIAVIAVVAFSLILTCYNIKKTEEKISSISLGKAVYGNVGVCVDVAPPEIVPSSYLIIAVVGVNFEYQINAISPSNRTIYFYDNTTLFEIEKTTGWIVFTPTVDDIGTHVIKISARHDICPGTEGYAILILKIIRPPVPSPRPSKLLPSPILPDTEPPIVVLVLSNTTVYVQQQVQLFCVAKDNKNPIKGVIIEAPEQEKISNFSCNYNDSAFSANCSAFYQPSYAGAHLIKCFAWDVADNEGSDSKLLMVQEVPIPHVPVPYVPYAVCGNDICESGENQESCCIDCGCPGPIGCKHFKCINNRCVQICCLFGYCCVWLGLCWYWWIVIALIIIAIAAFISRKKGKKEKVK